jgi:hypothetical protein
MVQYQIFPESVDYRPRLHEHQTQDHAKLSVSVATGRRGTNSICTVAWSWSSTDQKDRIHAWYYLASE